MLHADGVDVLFDQDRRTPPDRTASVSIGARLGGIRLRRIDRKAIPRMGVLAHQDDAPAPHRTGRRGGT